MLAAHPAEFRSLLQRSHFSSGSAGFWAALHDKGVAGSVTGVLMAATPISVS
jgi:hypothetical protein